MRGKVKRALALLIGCLTAALLGGATGALAMDSTTYTVTYGAQYNSMGMFVRIQDAFVPVGTYLTSVGLSAPEDMCLYEGSLYIADSGNGRIIVYELASGKVESFGEDVLKGPTGIWLDGGGNIYVADYRAEEVVIFGPDRRELRRLGKPQESYYGSSPYKPKKVAVNDFGTIFVVSEGTSEGILQFNADGSFNGFFGANTTGKLSLIEWFQKIFYTEEQKDRMLLRTPPPIVSLDIAEDNMVFSVSQTGDDFNSIKRLNLAGTNTFAESNYTRPDYVDVSVTENGSYYAVTSNGYIDEYSSEGVFLYQFGGRASNSDRNGVMTVVSAVESDEDGNIYLLDKERGLIQVWSPTDFADLVNSANSAYNAGSYEESLAAWGEVLRMSPNTYMANVGCADSLFQLMRYEEAAEYYKLCGERERYSDCFWEMRSEWMRRNIEWVLLAVLILFAIGLADHFARRRWAYHEYVSEAVDGFKGRHPLVKQLTTDAWYMVLHPIDGAYYIKQKDRGSFAAASILYVTAFAVSMVCRGLTSFVFGGGYWIGSSPLAVALIQLGPAALFLVGTYLISAINEGKATFRQMYVILGYSLTAFIVLWPFMVVLSYLLTWTEVFMYDLLCGLILGYTGVLVFISIRETNMYTIPKTITNVLLTVFFMAMAIIAAAVLFILWRELLSFVLEVFEEVRYRAFQ
jgi:sugar lactone lactonase YvrE